MGFLIEWWKLFLRLLGFNPRKQIDDGWKTPEYFDPSFRYEEEKRKINETLEERKRQPFDVKESERRLEESKKRREAFENDDD